MDKRQALVGCVITKCNAPKISDGALAYGVTHPTTCNDEHLSLSLRMKRSGMKQSQDGWDCFSSLRSARNDNSRDVENNYVQAKVKHLSLRMKRSGMKQSQDGWDCFPPLRSARNDRSRHGGNDYVQPT
ncbi:hypothetical protein Cal7507_1330 [Calothrix sp. PCC 7507]|nr:hypothetical protein Cal7507_1330 [Calothrix sp. PCC 7507]